MSANQKQNESQKELSAREAARKEKLLRELLAMGVDLGAELSALKEKELAEEKAAFLNAILAIEGFQEMVAKRELQAITIRFIPEREYQEEDGSTGVHAATAEIQYHEKATVSTIPAQKTGIRGEVAIQYRIADDNGKSVAEWSGRAMIPSAFLPYLKKDNRISSWTDDKIRESFSSGYKEKGWSEADHKLIHEIMGKYKV